MLNEKIDKPAKSFAGFETFLLRLCLMEGPGIFCYNLETLDDYVNHKLCSLAEEIVESHINNCPWCNLLTMSLISLKVVFTKSYYLGELEAAKKYFAENILPFMLENDFQFLEKITRGWNLV
jgi:hypothetical protein